MNNTIKCRFCNWTTRKYGFGSNPEKAFGKLLKHIEDQHENEYELIESMRESLIDREKEEWDRLYGTEN